MSDVPRQTLCKLIARYGPGLCSDAGRCEGLLRDLCGAYRREINILMGALKERIPLDLLAAQSAVPRELLLTRLAKRLEDQLALTEEAARWAVDSWALALGVVTETEIEERKRKQVRVVLPPATTATVQLSPEDNGELKKSVANTRPPTASSSQQRQQTSRVQPPTVPRSPKAPAATPIAPPSPTGGSTIARQHSSARLSSRPQLSPTLNVTQPRDSSLDPTPKRRGGKWRGCLIVCFLLVILSVLLFLVAPLVVSVLREEQRRINNEPPRIPSQ